MMDDLEMIKDDILGQLNILENKLKDIRNDFTNRIERVQEANILNAISSAVATLGNRLSAIEAKLAESEDL